MTRTLPNYELDNHYQKVYSSYAFFIFFAKITYVNAEIIKSISVNGNERITDKTVIIFSKSKTTSKKVFEAVVINRIYILLSAYFLQDLFYLFSCKGEHRFTLFS